MSNPIKVPLRAARLFATLREQGTDCDTVSAVAVYGDLRIEVEVPYDEWPRDDDGLSRTAEVELT